MGTQGHRLGEEEAIAASLLCRVHIDYFGAIAGIVKKRTEEISLPRDRATIAGLIAVLSETYGPEFEKIITRDRSSAPVVTIFVNGESISSEADAQAKLTDGAQVEVSLVNQMYGG